VIAQANGVAADSIEVGSHRDIHPAHLRQLAASGITAEQAAAEGIYSEHDRKKLAQLVEWKAWSARLGSALVFPYRDAGGSVAFCRLKPDNPPERNGKLLKYLQPKGVRVRCYFPVGVREELAAGSVRILITEGEKKSISATRHGFPTIGLSGVNAWCKAGTTMLNSDLAAIEWKGRKVYICFDSDAETNATVQLEQQKLAMALEREGAIVRVVNLPAGPPDVAGEPTKCGLDDFLVEYGPGELEKLIEQAQPAEKPDPGSLKDDAKNADLHIEAKLFLSSCGIGDQPRIRYHQGVEWYWKDGAFAELATGDLRAKAIEHLADRFTRVRGDHASNLLEHLRSQSLIPSHLEAPLWLSPRADNDPPAHECVAFRNGVLHLPSYAEGRGKLIEPTPRFFATNSVAFNFAPDAPEPVNWLAFLRSIWGDDEQSPELLCQWMGYTLTSDTRMQKALFCVGVKRGGKSTIARVHTGLMGRNNVASPTLSSLGERFGLQSLVGKPLAIIADARLSGKSDQAPIVERLLSLTGEDLQCVDRKHRDPVTCKLPTRFCIISNELPRLSDSSGALVGRLLLLEMTRSFYGNEDHDLTTKLLAELPGIFNWAVGGWVRLRERGRFVQPDAAIERLQDLSDLSSPVGEFLRERCEVEPDATVETKHVYASWSSWCAAKGMKPTGDNVFGRDLLAAASSVRRQRLRHGDGRTYHYVGLRLLAGSEW
jgi:putative DNA primase/helicase